MALFGKKNYGISLTASDLEREWMGGYVPEPMVCKGKLAQWNEVVCERLCGLEGTEYGADITAYKEGLKALRDKAAEQFGLSGEAGEEYQSTVAEYFARKLYRLRFWSSRSMEEFLTELRRKQIADRIIEERFDDFKTFYAENYFALSEAKETKENAEALALLNAARGRYGSHVMFRRLTHDVEDLTGKLDEAFPDYRRCREAREEIGRIRALLDGTKLPEEELASLIERLTDLQTLYNRTHTGAERVVEPVLVGIRELEKKRDGCAEDLGLEIPLVNPACRALILRLQKETPGAAPAGE